MHTAFPACIKVQRRRGISGWIEQHRLLSGFSKETVPNLAIVLLCCKIWELFRQILTLAVVTRASRATDFHRKDLVTS